MFISTSISISNATEAALSVDNRIDEPVTASPNLPTAHLISRELILLYDNSLAIILQSEDGKPGTKKVTFEKQTTRLETQICLLGRKYN